MNLRSIAVPAGAFLIAVMLSLAAGPMTRLSARAMQSGTYPGCETTLEILGKEKYLPRGDEGGDELKRGNAFDVRIKWDVVGGSWDGTKRKFIMRLGGPAVLRGSCNNKGEKYYPDYVFGAADNPKWEINNDVPEYDGVYSESAVTRNKYGPGVWVYITVRSFDFGAWTRVFGRAEGCPEKNDRMPLDTDEDTLPDRWELGKRFFDNNGNILEYNIGAKSTYNGEPDENSDRDGGFDPGMPDRTKGMVDPKKVHDEPGDGFSAFEEYRGLFVQGKHYRMNELLNDAGPQVTVSNRGTLMKNVFVHDPDELVKKNSRVLPQHGVQFHRIKQDEMSKETYPETDSNNYTYMATGAGYIDENSTDRGQRAIFLKDWNIPFYGYTPGFSINGNFKQVRINVGKVRYAAENMAVARRFNLINRTVVAREIDFDDLLNMAVAHEVGHKMTLRHNSSELQASAVPAPLYDNTVFWFQPDPPGIRHWQVVEVVAERLFGLRFNALEGVSEEAGAENGDASEWYIFGAQLFEMHDRQHLPTTRLINTPGLPDGTLPFLPHTGTLMDARPEYNYLRKPLPAVQRQKEELKSLHFD